MAGNEDLKSANKNKNDEFYTQLSDIEKEMKHYKDHFKGKVIFCNCDDPYESNFFKYFALNFNYLELKKLIATCYSGSSLANTQLNLFDLDEKNLVGNAYKIEITEVIDEHQDVSIDLSDVKYLIKNNKNVLTKLNGDGDFRSKECIKLMEESDIIVTNPPFSLFREFVDLIVTSNKEFIILGNVNAITYKDIFKLIIQKKIWLGASIHSGDREFRVPDHYPLKASGYRIDENGIKYIKVKGVRWFTNIDYKERYEDLVLYKNYSQDEFPSFENFDAINVNKTSEIPCDYYECIGVPITFLDKYNPKQFEIVCLGIVGSCEFSSERSMEILKDGRPTGKFTKNAKGTLYRKYNPKKDTYPTFRGVENDELYSSIYARIIIKRRCK